MRTQSKDKKPTIVYYIQTGSNSYIGPYGNKPSQKMLDKVYATNVATFNLIDVSKPSQKIGVIALSVNDFLAWKKENLLIESGPSRKNYFISDNKTYYCVSTIDGMCGYTFDNVIETENANKNKNYELIKAGTTVCIKPKKL
jgi:hypothetical protein